MRTHGTANDLEATTKRSSQRESIIGKSVLVLTGYGIHVGVERGQLVFTDGVGRERRTGTLNRATCGLRRLVVIGHTGTVSLDAFRWLYDIGAAFVQLDADGQVIVANGPSGLNDARLRRAQALAATNGVGVAITRDLLNAKLAGQRDVLSRLPNSQQCIAVIDQALSDLDGADTPARLRTVEAQAANAYWTAWSGVPIRFAKKDQFLLPAQWPLFLARSSPLTKSSRASSNPINTILNYMYAILETEVRLAVLAMGMDPGMGMLHADLKGHDSFVFDVIEPLRPVVDDHVLTLLETRTFSAREFFETRQGVCRLLPPMAKVLAEMGPHLARATAPVVEQVAQRLAEKQGTVAMPLRVPTLLSQANRSAGRDGVRTAPKKDAPTGRLSAPNACQDCGTILDRRGRMYCDQCLPNYRDEHAASFSDAGRKRMAELRAAGRDPSKGGKVGKRRGAKNSQRMREQKIWESEHGFQAEPEVFKREILPTLQQVSLGAIAKSTGLSEQYCSLIRRGLKVPHERHWENLRHVRTTIDERAGQ